MKSVIQYILLSVPTYTYTHTHTVQRGAVLLLVPSIYPGPGVRGGVGGGRGGGRGLN